MIKEKIAESKVIIENGEIKTIFSDEIENNGGWMSVEESMRLCLETIDRIEELQRNENINMQRSA